MSFDLANFTVAAPLLVLAAGALVILLLDMILPARDVHRFWYVAAVGAVGVAMTYLAPLWGAGRTGFGGALVMDQMALVFSLILLVATGLTVFLSAPSTDEDKSGYLALVLWGAMGMLTMAGAADLLTIFLGLELLSLALYVVVAFDQRRAGAREAALKYFVLGSVASAFLLFGFALVYGAVGSTGLAEIARASATLGGSLYFKVGVGLSLVGFAFKLALVPFHSWAPDVYDGAPTPVTAFMSVGTKGAAFVMMSRYLLAVVPVDLRQEYLLPLAVLAVLSMLLGSTVGIWQNDLKRLMAYSGIAHAGYLIMAVVGQGPDGMTAAAYYLAAYLFTAMGIFAVIGLLESEGHEGSSLATFGGLYYRRPALAVSMTLLMFGLAGLPPSGGFLGKLLLARAALNALDTAPVNAWLTLIGLILSTGISAYVYLRVVGTMFKQPVAESAGNGLPVMAGAAPEALALTPAAVRNNILVVLLVGVAGTLWLGILPGGPLSLLTVWF